MTEICLICGKNEGKYNNMCSDCFRKSTTAAKLPEILKMKICLGCNYRINPSSNKRTAAWQDGVNEVIQTKLQLEQGAILESLEVDFEEKNDYLLKIELMARAELKGLEFTEKMKSEMRLDYGICSRCSRMHGNYYEAIIQFRGGQRSPSETELKEANAVVLKRAEESNSTNGFVSNVEMIHKGLDFYLGDKSLARNIAKELQQKYGGVFKESFSIAGRKDGTDVFRATYLVRLPEYRIGDFIEYNDKIFQVLKLAEKSASVHNLTTGEKKVLRKDEIEKIRMIHGDVYEAVVVSVSENEVQLLDPVSYRTVTIITPKNLKPGEKVKVFRFRERLHTVPN